MDLIISGVVIGGIVLLVGWLVNRSDPNRQPVPRRLPATADEAKSLPQTDEPSLSAGSDFGIAKLGPYRMSVRMSAAVQSLSDEDKLTQLMIASCCEEEGLTEKAWLTALARSLTVDFLVDSLARGVGHRTVAFALKLRDMPSDARHFRELLTSVRFSMRDAARIVLSEAYGLERSADILAGIVSDNDVSIDVRRETAEVMARHESGQDRLKSLLSMLRLRMD